MNATVLDKYNEATNVVESFSETGEKKYTVRDIGEVQSKPVYSALKRVFDFFCSLIAIIVLSIPMLIVAIVIKCDSKGPAIYKQERLGYKGKPFTVYKFRSMRVDAEASGAQWAKEKDTRVTRIGGFIRKTRIDELPQLFNILSGSMSIVGPRPERPFFYGEFAKYIDGFEQRMLVPPGLTGWAQINGGYDLRPEEKIVYDIYYIDNRSVIMDLKCILRTVAVVFNHNGAR